MTDPRIKELADFTIEAADYLSRNTGAASPFVPYADCIQAGAILAAAVFTTHQDTPPIIIKKDNK